VEKPLSKARIDRLGEQLRRETYGEAELRLLDEYRRGFGGAYDAVVETIQRVLEVPVSGRPAKSTTSIIEKLKRESIRLSQMQDIAGCRCVVSDVRGQDDAIVSIRSAFQKLTIQDRRAKPSHGYRAVHVIVRDSGKPIEVQVRTQLQHVWAEMSEKYADVIDPAIKYGGGPGRWRANLDELAEAIGHLEAVEVRLIRKGAADGEAGQVLREGRVVLVGRLQAILKNLDALKGNV
jgi:putative GTP pyrophosphokinase